MMCVEKLDIESCMKGTTLKNGQKGIEKEPKDAKNADDQALLQENGSNEDPAVEN